MASKWGPSTSLQLDVWWPYASQPLTAADDATIETFLGNVLPADVNPPVAGKEALAIADDVSANVVKTTAIIATNEADTNPTVIDTDDAHAAADIAAALTAADTVDATPVEEDIAAQEVVPPIPVEDLAVHDRPGAPPFGEPAAATSPEPATTPADEPAAADSFMNAAIAIDHTAAIFSAKGDAGDPYPAPPDPQEPSMVKRLVATPQGASNMATRNAPTNTSAQSDVMHANPDVIRLRHSEPRNDAATINGIDCVSLVHNVAAKKTFVKMTADDGSTLAADSLAAAITANKEVVIEAKQTAAFGLPYLAAKLATADVENDGSVTIIEAYFGIQASAPPSVVHTTQALDLSGAAHLPCRKFAASNSAIGEVMHAQFESYTTAAVARSQHSTFAVDSLSLITFYDGFGCRWCCHSCVFVRQFAGSTSHQSPDGRNAALFASHRSEHHHNPLPGETLLPILSSATVQAVGYTSKVPHKIAYNAIQPRSIEPHFQTNLAGAPLPDQHSAK